MFVCVVSQIFYVTDKTVFVTPLKMAAIPEWKQALLKQKHAKEESMHSPVSEDKYAGLPQWKRDILLKKEEDVRKADSEKPKVIFGVRSSGSSTV